MTLGSFLRPSALLSLHPIDFGVILGPSALLPLQLYDPGLIFEAVSPPSSPTL